MRDPPGCEAWDSASGVRVLDLAFCADPAKDAEWEKRESQGIPPSQWRREMYKDEDIYEGDPVFRDFIYDRHAPARFRSEMFPILQGSTFWGGWDCGMNTHQPAFALAQVTRRGQILWMLEVVPVGGMPFAAFAPIVRQRLQEALPGDWVSVTHWADPTGKTASGLDARSAFDVAAKHGLTLKPCSTNSPEIREDAVVWGLTDWISQDGDDPAQWVPRMLYCEMGCPILVEGMKGAYCNQISKAHEATGPGMVMRRPAKNFFSHVNDAHQYDMVELRRRIFGVRAKSVRYAGVS